MTSQETKIKEFLVQGEFKNEISNIPMEIAPLLLELSDSKDDREKFTQIVLEFSQSEEIRQQIIEKIGDPKPDETKNDYLSKAKAVLRQIFYKQFGIESE